uniref:Uncharacterized protein n=1 Tax=Arundo donax TaxID=35708 RepID=A0A0A9CT50_ARUDO
MGLFHVTPFACILLSIQGKFSQEGFPSSIRSLSGILVHQLFQMALQERFHEWKKNHLIIKCRSMSKLVLELLHHSYISHNPCIYLAKLDSNLFLHL